MVERLTDGQLRGACCVHCLIVGDADFAFGQQFLERSDVRELFTDADTPTKLLQVLSLKTACTVVGSAAQASMEARDF